jgi:hypothetical protein
VLTAAIHPYNSEYSALRVLSRNQTGSARVSAALQRSCVTTRTQGREPMRFLVLLVTCLFLASCRTFSPQAILQAPITPTSQVVIQTVLVTVVPTWPATATAATPTPPPTITPWIIVVTPTSPTAQASPTLYAGAGTPTATLPANVGGGLFTNLTRSGDHFALRCAPETVTFRASTENPYVVDVDFYYRIEDRLSVSISTWQWAGSMISDNQRNFTIDFPASRVDPDLRSHRAWFDYQFVGVNKYGDAVGRSARISQQVTYTIACSD